LLKKNVLKEDKRHILVYASTIVHRKKLIIIRHNQDYFACSFIKLTLFIHELDCIIMIKKFF